MPLRYLKTKSKCKKANARNEKKLLEIREVGQKICGKPYPPGLNSCGIIQLFRRGGGGGVGGGSKASLGLKRDKQRKNKLLYKLTKFQKAN